MLLRYRIHVYKCHLRCAVLGLYVRRLSVAQCGSYISYLLIYYILVHAYHCVDRPCDRKSAMVELRVAGDMLRTLYFLKSMNVLQSH